MAGIARMAKRHSEQMINSILKLEDLAECFMLSDVNGFIVEFDDPAGQVSYGVVDLPILISYLNGTPFLKARYVHRNRMLHVHAAGDDEENILFSINLVSHSRFKQQHPASILAGHMSSSDKKSASLQQHQNEIAKLKHKTGLTIYRINRSTKLTATQIDKGETTDLQIVRANQATIPFLDMKMERTCCGTFLHWLGLTFHRAQFACYKRDQFIGTLRPKIGLGPSQIGYVVKFEKDIPAPQHVSKTIVLASAITMLLTQGPINVSDDITEE